MRVFANKNGSASLRYIYVPVSCRLDMYLSGKKGQFMKHPQENYYKGITVYSIFFFIIIKEPDLFITARILCRLEIWKCTFKFTCTVMYKAHTQSLSHMLELLRACRERRWRFILAHVWNTWYIIYWQLIPSSQARHWYSAFWHIPCPPAQST